MVKHLADEKTRIEELQEITVDELLDRYSVILLDSYGVLIHSSGTLPGARELISKLNKIEKPYYILTNDASTLPTTRAKKYQGLGLNIGQDSIIASGSLLNGYFESHSLSGVRCVVLGTEDSVRFVESAGGEVVPLTGAFDALVIGDQTGYPLLDTVNAAISALFRKLDRGEQVHLVLPNPDLIYLDSDDGFGIASGSVAMLLEAALQLRYPDRPDLRFARLGKPHPAIFEEALRRSGTRDMVMIGDSLENDIRGANSFGIDSALVGTGVTTSAMRDIPEDLQPTYYINSLLPSQ